MMESLDQTLLTVKNNIKEVNKTFKLSAQLFDDNKLYILMMWLCVAVWVILIVLNIQKPIMLTLTAAGLGLCAWHLGRLHQTQRNILKELELLTIIGRQSEILRQILEDTLERDSKKRKKK